MVTRLQTDRLATVFGGSGFVGRHTVRALARRGYRIRAAVRRPDLAGYLQPMGVVGQVLPVQCNLRYPESIAPVIEGADTVINAVGILMPTGRQTFDAVHLHGAREVARAAKAAGVQTFVHISAIGANSASEAVYARSKGEAEAAVLAEFPEAVILRPSIVFGPEDEFFNRFAQMATISPFLPLIGGGRTRFQPVFVGDVAEAVAIAADGLASQGVTYELGGPEIQSFRQLLDKVKIWTDRKCRYLPMPFWAAKLLALATWPLPNGLRPLTVDQVRMLRVDNVVSAAAEKDGRTLAGLGINAPHSTDAIVPEILERYRPRGQFSHYRG